MGHRSDKKAGALSARKKFADVAYRGLSASVGHLASSQAFARGLCTSLCLHRLARTFLGVVDLSTYVNQPYMLSD